MKKITLQASKAFANFESFKSGNTEVRACSTVVQMFLHGNIIAQRGTHSNELFISHAGWRTATTKERLNGLLEVLGQSVRIFQKSFVWYIQDTDTGEEGEFSHDWAKVPLKGQLKLDWTSPDGRIYTLSQADLRKEATYRIGQEERKAGIPCRSANGAYLEGWNNPERGPYFVAVDAAHLVDQEGVRPLIDPLAPSCSVKAISPKGQVSYLSDEDKSEWPKPQAIQQLEEALRLPHFAGYSFELEEA